MQQLGVGQEADGFGLHRGIDRDPGQVLLRNAPLPCATRRLSASSSSSLSQNRLRQWLKSERSCGNVCWKNSNASRCRVGKAEVGVYPEWGRAGLLMSYSSDLADGFRHAGSYVAKILRGIKPGDLPIEQASKFTFVINLKTAKALGIAVPPTLLSFADEVIE
ncbi:hypothetical protein V1293_001989 [Bradyrhizobium sp. AZCC 1693]